MATVNKDFKIKQGLVVEGATGTINGENILTEGAGDSYITNLIGGSADTANTPNTVVKRDGNGDFAAGAVTVNRVNIGSVGYIEDDGSIEIVNTDGDDINIIADDIRLRATDDVLITSGDQGSAAGDIALTTNGGNIRFQSADVYLGTNIGFTDAERVATQGYVDQAELDAVSTANSDTDTKLADYTTTANLDTTVGGYGYIKNADLNGYALETYVDQAELDANAYTNERETAITTAYQSYADTAEQDAKDYADDLINDASTSSSEVWSAYKTSTEIGLAQAAAELHADNAIAALVDSAPATLDTLNELAAALQDNPDIIGDLQDIAAGKQDTLTAGSNIDITGATISVTGLDTDDVAEGTNLYFTNQRALDATASAYDTTGTAQSIVDALDTDDIEEGASNLYFTNQRALDATNSAYDAAGAASDAQTAAETFATNAINALDTDDIEEGVSNLYFSDVRAKTSAAALITGATKTNIVITGDENGLTITAENGVADSNTDDLAEGEENLYFTDERAIDAVSAADIYPNAVIINNLTKQVANQVTVATAGIATGISWAKESYRSAEFVVKVAYGDHTEISKVLLTLDVNDNIAITEYGNVTTNGSASSISADISGTDARLRVTTVNNNSTVTVLGTLIA